MSREQGRQLLEKLRLRDPNIATHYVDLVGVMVLVLDSDGKILFINKKGVSILGYEDEDAIIGRPWIDCFIPERLRTQMWTIFRQLFEGDQQAVEYFENPILTRSGEERTIAWHNTHLVDEADTTVATLSSGEDITDRRVAEQEFQASNEKLKTIFDCVADGIFVVDPQSGVFIDVNASGCTMFGYSREEVIGNRIEMLSSGAPPYNQDAAIGKLAQAASVAEPQPFEWECRTKTGETFWADILLRLVPYGGGPAVLASLRDITERKRSAEALRRSMEKTIEAVASTVEARDPYTAGHEQRVAALAVAIAREMHVEEAQIDGIKFAGIVHDVGKVRIPAEVLSKPGKLYKEEFDLLKTHAQAGYEILKGVDLPWPIATIVHQHHERLDGSGYPNGLRADGILIEARIVAVADVVESMTYPRLYRAGLGLDTALAEIETGKGRLYDGDAVNACSNLFRSGRFEFAAL